MILQWWLWSAELCHQVQLCGTSALKVKGTEGMPRASAPGFGQIT